MVAFNGAFEEVFPDVPTVYNTNTNITIVALTP